MSDSTATLTFTVTDDDTALAVGSGSLPVLGTPRLLAWCEAATCAALESDLREGESSVGTRVAIEHQAPSPVGARLEVTASVMHIDGRLRRFTVGARHTRDSPVGRAGAVVATGEVTRVIVDVERFVSRLR
ncbi:thioesterase family protein [Nocardioides acrostichi]|uniref:Thioesterase n=1 Tax=Nocardioides acrostichi TaxID=2784339 RepID=A0A930UZB3_9ACTN|nr:hotdog domain-containing protein [Nocardioides acrostichi]MBF4160877.1 thioesterase [Nocardioides acrostichi]